MIHVRELVKHFGYEEALKGTTFQIEQGEIFGLLGPSGSGKTTTIKILTGELQPTSGEVEVLGFQSKDFNQTNYIKQLGILSDKSSLYERLTVEDNLELFRKLYQVEKSSIDTVLSAVGLLDEKKKRISKLSRGMKQRILLCKAVIHKPKLLLLDEPTSALDPNTTERIHDMLLDLKEQGTTILLTTHDMEEATLLCDRVAFLDGGVIRETGAPNELRHSYKRNIIHLTSNSGEVTSIARTPDNAVAIQAALLDRNIIDFHTDFPSLGEVFKKVTGKELV